MKTSASLFMALTPLALMTVPAVAAVIRDAAPAQAQLGWRPDTSGKDLVETLGEAAGTGAPLA